MDGTHDTDATTTAGHPIVGLWSWGLAHIDHPDAASLRSNTLFHADGTFVEAHPFLDPGLGLWRPTGERTVDLLVHYHTKPTASDGTGRNVVTVSGPVEVNATGDGATLMCTYEIRALDGTVVESGVEVETATRITIEEARTATP